jgi:hypothetical protein
MPIAGDEAIALGGLASDEALELFAAHLERHAPGVHVEAASLEALVSSLEGNPLALGLSAARVAADGMPAVLDRMARTTLILDSRDDALAEDAPLRTALGASLQLLSPVEQHLLVSLAVFDTFDVAAAEALLEAPRERKIGELLRDLVVVRQPLAVLNTALVKRRYVPDHAVEFLPQIPPRCRQLADGDVDHGRCFSSHVTTPRSVPRREEPA